MLTLSLAAPDGTQIRIELNALSEHLEDIFHGRTSDDDPLSPFLSFVNDRYYDTDLNGFVPDEPVFS